MTAAARIPQLGDLIVARMSPEELRAEWRATQDEMIAMAAGQLELAEALWPDGESERPDLEDGVTSAQLIAGVKSLHEICDRLYSENAALRAELRRRADA